MRRPLPRARAWRFPLIIAALTTIAIPATEALGGATGGRAGDPSGVASVTRGPVASQLDATGTLQYLAQPDGSPFTVIDHAVGTLTALPSVGRVIEQGQVLYRVADTPVVLLDGTTPAYRSLSEGDTGSDVRELNADLVALGYGTSSGPEPTSNYFGSSTAAALEKLQAKLGCSQTGTLPLGEAVFLPAPIRITAATAILGTRYAPDAPGAGPATPRAEFVDFTTTTRSTTAPAPRDPDRCKPRKRHRNKCRHPRRTRHHNPGRHPRGRGPGTRHGATARGVASKPGAGRGSHNGSGNPAARPSGGSGSRGGSTPAPTPARPILRATSTHREVIVQLDAHAARAVKVDQRALVTLPSGRTTTGSITAIGKVASSSGMVTVHLSLAHPDLAGDLDQASVHVRITTASVADALRIPVTALLTEPDGQAAVKIVDPHGRARLLPVKVGLYDDASGLVQITGTLAPGEHVLEPGG